MDYSELPNEQTVTKTKSALEEKGYVVHVLADGAAALKKIQEIMPEGVSIMNGGSTTLEQIGYSAVLESGKHNWNDLHAKITAEDDKETRDKLRQESVLSEYYLGSVHALVQNGVFVIASNTGSQLPHVVFTSNNLIFVVSTKKIVSTLDDAMKRLYDHVVKLEDERMMKAYNAHTAANKVLIFNGESAIKNRKITFLLVTEDLGF